MIAGISTACLYPMPTEEALSVIAGKGVRAAEVFINSVTELEPGYLRELRKIADGAGMQILSVHPFTSGMEPMLFFSDYARRFEDGREFYRSYYRAANLLGADIVVFHGNIVQFRMEQQEYFRRYDILLKDASREGVRLCHENVNRCTGRTPQFYREMSRALPHAQYVFDVKQAVRAGEDVFHFMKTMGQRIAHVHISDHAPGRDCLPIGTGVFNISQFLSCLDFLGFDGGVVVELYRENFGDPVELFAGYQRLCVDLSTLS